MSNNLAIQTLLNKMHQLMDEKHKMLEKYKTEIAQMNAAILALSEGEPVEVPEAVDIFDDQNPDYIRSSSEEI